MRVITGIARGRKLFTLQGTDTVRPTTDRVKEALFSAIQFDIEGRRVLDLFSGSGQLGIEALSRGAASAVFVDCSPASLEVTRKNLELTDLAGKATVISGDYSSFLTKNTSVFDIAFLDPPYSAGILNDSLLKTTAHLSDYGTVICEHPASAELPVSVGGFNLYRTYKFGSIAVTIYKKEVTDE